MKSKTRELEAEAVRQRQEQDGMHADSIAALETKLRTNLRDTLKKHAVEVKTIESKHHADLRRAKSSVYVKRESRREGCRWSPHHVH